MHLIEHRYRCSLGKIMNGFGNSTFTSFTLDCKKGLLIFKNNKVNFTLVNIDAIVFADEQPNVLRDGSSAEMCKDVRRTQRRGHLYNQAESSFLHARGRRKNTCTFSVNILLELQQNFVCTCSNLYFDYVDMVNKDIVQSIRSY